MKNELVVNSIDDITKKVLCKGLNETIYMVKDDMVFKTISNPEVEPKLKKLSKFYSTHFFFPRVLVYDKSGKLLGYITEFIDGNTLDKLPSFVSLEHYKTEIERIEREIEVLTCYRLGLFDVGKTNIIYNKDIGMRIINTDTYTPDDHSKVLYMNNMIRFTRGVTYPLVEDLSETSFVNDKLNKYSKQTLCGLMKPSDFISELEKESRIKGFDKPESVLDLKKQMRLL